MRAVLLLGRAVIALFTLLSLGGAIAGTELLERREFEAFLTQAEDSVWVKLSYERALWFCLLVLCAVILWETFANRKRPVTVLSSTMSVEFQEVDGSKVVISRTQYLRANHPDVTAYYMEASTSFGGFIDRRSLTVNAWAGSRELRSESAVPPTRGNERLEIAHVFDKGMPFGLGNVLIPAFLLRLLLRAGITPRFIVRRDLSLTYVNEHTLNDTYYQIAADRYIQRNISVRIIFHPGRLPVLTNGVLFCEIIRRNGIERIPFNRVGGQCTFEYRFRRLQNERVRIPFRFPDAVPGDQP